MNNKIRHFNSKHFASCLQKAPSRFACPLSTYQGRLSVPASEKPAGAEY